MPILNVSALKGTGLKKILPLAAQIHEECRVRVPTGKLNRAMLSGSLGSNEAVTARHAPRLTLAGPVTLPNGGAALVGRLSLYLNDGQGHARYWGTAAIFLRFPEVLAASDLYMLGNMNMAFGLWRACPQPDEKRLIVGNIKSESGPVSIEVPVNILNARWFIRVASNEA